MSPSDRFLNWVGDACDALRGMEALEACFTRERNARLLALLKRLEWEDGCWEDGSDFSLCRICQGNFEHAPRCELAALIQELQAKIAAGKEKA